MAGVYIEVLVEVLSLFSDGCGGVNSSILSHYSYISNYKYQTPNNP